MFFSGSNFNKFYIKPEIKSLPFSDHRAVIVDIRQKNEDRGAGIFKIDTSLFEDKNYIKIITDTIRRLGVKTRHVRMSRFDLFRYVVRLSEAHIVSNSCTSAIISNGVMSKKQNKSKASKKIITLHSNRDQIKA